MAILEFFKGCETLDSIKKKYRELCKQYHPDLHGSSCEEIMKRINAEYETVYENARSGHSAEKSDSKETMSAGIFANIINELIVCEGLNIDIVGFWIWVDGNTYPYKDKLKSLGFRWSKNRKKWHFGEIGGGYRKGVKLSYGQICDKYGCESLTGKNTAIVCG